MPVSVSSVRHVLIQQDAQENESIRNITGDNYSSMGLATLNVQARQHTTAPSMWSRKLAQQVQSSLLLVSIWTSIIPSIVQSCIRTARLAELLFYSGDTRRYVRQPNGAEAATNFCR